MRYLILMIIVLSCLTTLYSQGTEKINLYFDISLGIIPVKLSGVYDVGNGNETIIDDQAINLEPVFRMKDTNAIMSNALLHFGSRFPFYKNKNWSIGAKLNIGIGYQMNIKAAAGLKSLVFDFPQYLYYRNFKNSFDYSVMLGYKYSYNVLPTQYALLAFEIYIDDVSSVTFYGTLNRYKYYMLFTDGTLKPMAGFRELGITYSIFF